MIGVNYLPDQYQDWSIVRYHGTGNRLRNLRQEGKMVDILSCGDRMPQKLINLGFEIEKNNLPDHSGREGKVLFWKYETDSSCGYEAVTHVLPVIPSSMWRDKILSLMDDAAAVLDADSGEVNGEGTAHKCGGHINISVLGIDDSFELYRRLRPYMGVLMALWPERQRSGYCRQNWDMSALSFYRTKGEAVVPRQNGIIELRFPARVKSADDLKARYLLLCEVLPMMLEGASFEDVLEIGARYLPRVMETSPNFGEYTGPDAVTKYKSNARQFAAEMDND